MCVTARCVIRKMHEQSHDGHDVVRSNFLYMPGASTTKFASSVACRPDDAGAKLRHASPATFQHPHLTKAHDCCHAAKLIAIAASKQCLQLHQQRFQALPEAHRDLCGLVATACLL